MRSIFHTEMAARPNSAVPAPALLLLAAAAVIALAFTGCEPATPADFLRDHIAVVTVKEVQPRQYAAVTENGVNVGPSTAQIALMLDNNRKIPLRLGLNRPNPDDGRIDWTFEQISAGEVLVTINGFELGDAEQNLTLFMGADGRDFQPFSCTLRCTTVIGTTPCTVTFIDNNHGTVTPEQTVYDGSLLGYPDQASAPDGKYLEGWYRDSGCTDRWNFAGDTVTGDTTLYANWADIAGAPTYKVTFTTTKGTAPAQQTVLKGTFATEPIPPTFTGETVVGWYQDDDTFSIRWNFTAESVTGDITLYAKWMQAYTITFDMQGHGTPLASLTVAKGDTVPDPGITDSTEWKFRGWFTDNTTWSTSTSWTFGTGGTAVDANKTLFAYWTKKIDDEDFEVKQTPTSTIDFTTYGSTTLYDYLNGIRNTAGRYVINLGGTGPTTHTFTGKITLASNVKISLRVIGSGTHTISPGGNHSLFQISGIIGGGSKLIIRGPHLIGRGSTYPNPDGALVSVDTDGTLDLRKGSIQENEADTGTIGGGVSLSNGGTFNMYDGTISGNRANGNGGGVHLNNSGDTFKMCGGTISGNTASNNGGGVSVANGGTFIMSGGTITSGNTASNFGGGVFVNNSDSTFIMSSGTISDNTVTTNSGGGVCLLDGTFTMNGGTISGNSATGGSGGGVYVASGTFTKPLASGSNPGGTITGNDADPSSDNNNASGNGHAVYVLDGGGKYRNTTAGPEDDLDSSAGYNNDGIMWVN